MRTLIPLLLIILSVFVLFGCTATDLQGTGESAQAEIKCEYCACKDCPGTGTCADCAVVHAPRKEDKR